MRFHDVLDLIILLCDFPACSLLSLLFLWALAAEQILKSTWIIDSCSSGTVEVKTEHQNLCDCCVCDCISFSCVDVLNLQLCTVVFCSCLLQQQHDCTRSFIHPTKLKSYCPSHKTRVQLSMMFVFVAAQVLYSWCFQLIRFVFSCLFIYCISDLNLTSRKHVMGVFVISVKCHCMTL